MKQERSGDEISYTDILRVLHSRWKLMLCITLIGGSLTCWYILRQNPPSLSISTVVEINMKGIEKSRNPDGSFFEKEQIIAPVVINMALEEVKKKFPRLDLGFLDSLKNEIRISGVVPKAVLNQQKKDFSFNYIPNKFKLEISTGRTDRNTSAVLTFFLEAVVRAYRNHTVAKYSDVTLVVTQFPENFLDEYEFGQIIDIFKANTRAMAGILDGLLGINPDAKNGRMSGENLRSFKHNISLADIRTRLAILEDVKLARYDALIGNLHLSRHPEDQLKIYEETIHLQELELDKLQRISASTRTLLGKLIGGVIEGAGDEQRPVVKGSNFSSVVVDNDLLNNLKKDSHISILVNKYLETEDQTGELIASIARLKKKREMLSKQMIETSDFSQSQKKWVKEITPVLASIYEEIIGIGNLINTVNSEYIQSGYNINKSIQLAQVPQLVYHRKYRVPTVFGLSYLFCAAAALIIVAFVEANARSFRPPVRKGATAAGVKDMEKEEDEENIPASPIKPGVRKKYPEPAPTILQ